MAGASDYLENKLLDHTFRNTSYTPAATVYIKLHIGDPDENGTSNAATETTRKAMTFAAAASGSIATSASITWTSYPATETLTHFSIWDALTVGNCLATGQLSSSVSASSGGSVTLTTVTMTLD